MEKFSTWRDKATGIAPFMTPLPAATAPTPLPIRILLSPITHILGGVRTALVVLLLGIHFLVVEVLLKICLVVPPVYDISSRIVTAVLIRLVLLLLGFVSISVEDVSLKRTSRSQQNVAFEPAHGDVLIANSSSSVDLLYLAFRHNPTFLLPVSSLGSKASKDSPAKITSWRRSSLWSALRSCGALPERSERGETLEQASKAARGPVVIFPEGTTSNNRALLKPASVLDTLHSNPTPLKTFILSFRQVPSPSPPPLKLHTDSLSLPYSPSYEIPTSISPSATLPTPTSFNPFPHLFALASSPLPRRLAIRRLHPLESPKLSTATKAAEWEAVVETLSATGRWKRTGLDWEAKEGFLEYRAKRK